METFDAIKERRAVKHFDTNHHFTEQEIEKLMSATILSPTSFNIQHWRFVLVKDPVKREKIRKASWDQAHVTEASLLLIVCADLKAWEKQPERYWKNAPKETQNLLVPAIGSSYRGNEQFQRDEAIRSCGIAAQTLMLAAKSMGYDSCPMIGFDPQEVAKIINLPQDHITTMMIVVGKKLKDAGPRGGQLDLDKVLFTDSF